MSTARTAPAIASPAPPLSVVVRRTADGPPLAREPLTDADLNDYLSEAWMHSCLRRGFPDVPLSAVDAQFDLLFKSGRGGPLKGFLITTQNPAGKRFELEFSLAAVEHVAARAARNLVTARVLQPTDEYYYLLEVDEARNPVAGGRDGDAGVSITTSAAALVYVVQPLASLLRRAKPVGGPDDSWTPVIYTADARARAEAFSRRGGNEQPPVETGAMLVGSLCSCPESGEFYCVVDAALEARDAKSNKFSLEYTGVTWTRLQAILKARQSQPATATSRFLGQAHGHPFLPAGGAPPCEICLARPDLPCARTSCFASYDDRLWSSAVFARQPFQLCHIFGLNARNQPVEKLFGLRNGQLVERGYHVMETWEPSLPSSNFNHPS